jgi:hypothetical protein
MLLPSVSLFLRSFPKTISNYGSSRCYLPSVVPNLRGTLMVLSRLLPRKLMSRPGDTITMSANPEYAKWLALDQ